jgi:hypothetical protein
MTNTTTNTKPTTHALRNTVHGTYKLFTDMADKVCIETVNRSATRILQVEWLSKPQARDEWLACRASGSVPCAVPAACR